MDENMESSETAYVSEMVAYLGLPPLEYIQRSEMTRKVFDDQGSQRDFNLITLSS